MLCSTFESLPIHQGIVLNKRKDVPIHMNHLFVLRHLKVEPEFNTFILENYRGSNSNGDLEKFSTAFIMDPELPLPWNQELHNLHLFRQNLQKQIQGMEVLKSEIFQVLA